VVVQLNGNGNDWLTGRFSGDAIPSRFGALALVARDLLGVTVAIGK